MQAQLEAQRATQDFQRATEVLRAAKETISLAEQRLLEDDKRQFDSAWQEMLNHATQRVRVSAGVPVCTHLRVGGQGGGVRRGGGWACPRLGFLRPWGACASQTRDFLLVSLSRANRHVVRPQVVISSGVSAGLELSRPPWWQPPGARRSGPVLAS